MKTYQMLIIGVLHLLVLASCQKEETSPHITRPQNKTIRIDGATTAGHKTVFSDEIIVGENRPNPYARANVLAAFNTVYPNAQRANIPATHVYMKFLPKDWDALEALQEAIDAFEGDKNPSYAHDPYLFNYPIHKAIEQQGIYHHDPKISEELPSYHYAVVAPNFQVPTGVTSEVLAELVHLPYNTYIMAEAFRRVGATYYGVDGQSVQNCDPSCPNYPQCFTPQIDCNTGEIEPLPVPCEPSVSWHHCPAIFIPLPLSPSGGSTNACGCYRSEASNKPGGCIHVEDTQLGWKGVRNVKIYVKDLYFFGRETWSNHLGCWQVNHRYFGGIHPFVDWCNNKIEFRAMRGADITQLGHRLKQNCGTHGGGIYNDFQIRHHRFTDNRKIERAHWVASTALNTLYEFDSYAHQEGISTVHGSHRLRVWLLNNVGGAAAPMLNDLSRHRSDYNVAQYIAPIATSVLAFPLGFTSWSVTGNFPDVIYNYGSDRLRSDNMKSTLYHEYAHVAHYRGLPAASRYTYWHDNILRIVHNVEIGANPPYGHPNTTGAEKTAIMEAWANHIGALFADKEYGIDCQLSKVQPNQPRAERARYIYRQDGLERFNPNSGRVDAWIPEGIFWDLWDNKVHNMPSTFSNDIIHLGIADPVTDNVEGMSNEVMFRAITRNAPTEMNAVREAIKVHFNGDNSLIDSLFLEYGY